MKNKKLPIFWDIIKSSFLTISLILVIYTISQLVMFAIYIDEYEKDILEYRYEEIVDLSRNINVEISEKGFNDYLHQLIRNDDEGVRIYSADEIYAISNPEIWEDIKFYNRNAEYDTKVHRIFLPDMYTVVEGPIVIGNQIYRIQIIRENDMFKDFIETSFPILICTLILGLALSGIGAMYVSKRVIDKLRKLISAMNEIKEKGIGKRVEISDSKDEIDKVGIVFNSMMDEVEETFNEQSRFVSDASHELKTPLTALHGHLSMLKRWGKNDKERLEKSLDVCLSEVDRLKKLVNDMLVLSKAEKLDINFESLEEIDPELVLYDVIENYSLLNPNIRYNLNVEEGLKVKIDKNDLKQLLIIFIDNSIKYNDKENIEIQIEMLKEEDKFILEVKDNGIGIPKSEIKNVTKRLYKVDKSRVNNNSFGIGLSIAKRIVDNYNGDISIASELGKYTVIEVSL